MRLRETPFKPSSRGAMPLAASAAWQDVAIHKALIFHAPYGLPRCARNDNSIGQHLLGRVDRARGFTLIEVLVALAILAVALAALVKASSEHTRNTHYLQERTLAHWVGQNVFARYEAGLLSPQRGTTSGTVRQADQHWEYRVEIGEERPEAPLELPPVLRIEVTVWPAAGAATDVRARVVGYLLP